MNVYDFDKTIYAGDSTADFYIFCLKKNFKIIKFLPPLIFRFFKYYVFKKGDKTLIKENFYGFLKYINAQDLINEFWDENQHKIKKFYLKMQKNDDVIISASPYFLLKPICQRLNIKYLYASNVDPKSGKYNGVNCHGEEKVIRYRKHFNNEVIDNFYSDSYSDTPLALISKKAYIVKNNKISAWIFNK